MPATIRRLAVRSVLLASLVAVAVGTAQAAEPRHIDIASQPLAAALAQFAEQSGVKTLYPEGLLSGKRAPRIEGTLTPQQALDRLLAGSGLGYRFIGSDAVKIEAVPMPGPVTELAPVEVRAGQDDSVHTYAATIANTATKTDTPLMETPVSVQVVPQAVLADQMTTRLDKALNNVSGVFSSPMISGGGSGESTVIRGFKTADLYFDGVKVESSATGPIDMANVDHIEVLKGPAAILFGRVEPGGLVNVIKKAPELSPYSAAQIQVGSYDFVRLAGEITGPISVSNGLSFRIDAAHESAGSIQDYRSNRGDFVAASLRWQPNPATRADFQLEYKHAKDPVDYGIPAAGDRPISVSRQFSPNEPGNFNKSDETIASLGWSHVLDERWSLRQNFRWRTSRMENVSVGAFAFGAMGVGDGPTDLDRYTGRGLLNSHSFFTSFEAIGKLHAGGVDHTLLLGADSSRYSQWNPVTAELATFLNVDSGVRSDLGAGLTGLLIQDGLYCSAKEAYGLYVQDQIAFPRGIHLLVGLRHDRAKAGFTIDDHLNVPPGNLDSHSDDKATTPRLGLLWRASSNVSLYTNYVENFGAPNLTNTNASLGTVPAKLKPETAKQKELGAKYESSDKKLTASVALFDIVKQNVSVPDPNNPGFNILIGQVRNRGWEFDLAGELDGGWKVIAAASGIQSNIEKDAIDASGNFTGNQGHQLANVPKRSASLWTTYDAGPLRLGAGIVSRSVRQGDAANSFQLPGYSIVNAMAAYRWQWNRTPMLLQLNIDNLFDKDYFVSSSEWNIGGANRGEPRTVKATLRAEF